MKTSAAKSAIVSFVALAGVILFFASARAQNDEDLSLPPRLDGTPYESRLAAQPEERRAAFEEVIVIGENEWRLPDLGSAWRVRQKEDLVPARIETRFLPLYDPENQTAANVNPFSFGREMRRVGFIEVFRARFGRRSQN